MCQIADRFFAAIRVLSTEGTVKQRLIRAYVEQLETLEPTAVPEPIRTRFESLQAAMRAVPATEKETAVQVSVRKMSQAEAVRLTRSIVLMFAELVQVRATGERIRTGSDASRAPEAGAARLPGFLAR